MTGPAESWTLAQNALSLCYPMSQILKFMVALTELSVKQRWDVQLGQWVALIGMFVKQASVPKPGRL